MPLTTVSGTDPASQRGTEESVRAAVRELQGLTVKTVAGGGANADLAVAPLAATDVLVAVIEVVADTAVINDRLSVSAISAANVLHVNAVTTGNKLIVFYFHLP